MEHLTNTQPAASFTFNHLKCAKGVFRRVFWLHILMCVLLLAVGETNGQSSLPKAQNDSLWAVWNDAKQADTNRYKAIHTIIWKGYMNTDPDSALRIVELMLSDAEQKDRKSDRAQALNTRGAAYLMLGQNKNAEKSLISGLEQYVAIGDRKGIKEVYGNLANTYAQMGDFKKTLEYDSLTMVMAKKIGDARGIGKSMTNLGTTYYRLGRAEDAYRLIEEASEYLERGGYQPELASCLNNLGTLYRDQGDMSKAQITYQKSLGIMEKTDNPSGMAEVLLNLGNLNRLRGNYPLALEQTLKALKLAEAIPNETIMLVAYNNMGGIHSDEGNDSLSIAYHQHCLSLAESSGNTYYQAMSLSNIGKYFIKQQKYTEARPKMTRALQLRRAMGDAEGMAHSMQSLGELYKQNSETDIALSMYDSSAVIFRQFGMGSYVASSLNGKAAIYLEIGQVQKTIELGQEGLLLAKEASDPLETGNLANTLFKAFKLQNRHKEALEMHELFIQMRDSVWNEKNTRSIMSQQFQYNYEKKETILKAEQKSKDAIATSRIRNQRIAMMGMAGGGLLLLGLGISGFLLFRQRKRNETLAQSIAARDAERNRLARELHDGVAGELFGLQMADSEKGFALIIPFSYLTHQTHNQEHQKETKALGVENSYDSKKQ